MFFRTHVLEVDMGISDLDIRTVKNIFRILCDSHTMNSNFLFGSYTFRLINVTHHNSDEDLRKDPIVIALFCKSNSIFAYTFSECIFFIHCGHHAVDIWRLFGDLLHPHLHCLVHHPLLADQACPRGPARWCSWVDHRWWHRDGWGGWGCVYHWGIYFNMINK